MQPSSVKPQHQNEVKQTIDSIVPNVHDTLLSLVSKLDELNASFELLRRQVARMEAKTQLASTKMLNSSNCQSQGNQIDDICFDFDAVCANEGLPICTSEGLVEFEKKLKENSSYRQKIVRKIIIYNIQNCN